MPKFTVYATLTQQLECEVEADSYEEAQRIEESELITDDFEVVGACYTFKTLVEKGGE